MKLQVKQNWKEIRKTVKMITEIKQNISLERIALRISLVAMITYGVILTLVLLL